MGVIALGYIGLGVKDVAAWRVYAGQFLGAQVDDAADGGLRLRVDTRAWRIAIHPTGEDDIVYAGWELAGARELGALVEKLTQAGVATEVLPDLAKERGVLGLARCVDPAGVTCELFWGATERFEKPFVSPVGVRGFKTGDEGLGHIVVGAHNLGEVQAFYEDMFGFRYSDLIDMPVGPDMTIPVTFMHCNARHHSFAFAPPAPHETAKLIHFMLQTEEFDDVGHALDRVEKYEVEMANLLGRHSNDHMLSFYAVTPSGFEVEYGWGARSIDDATWVPARHDRISAWGHKFVRKGRVLA